MLTIKQRLFDYLKSLDFSDVFARYITVLLIMVGLLLILWVIRLLIRKILLSAFVKLAEKTKSKFDDILAKNRVPRNIANIVPLLIAYQTVPVIFEDFIPEKSVTQRGVEVFGILLFLWIIQSVISSIGDYLKTLKNFKDKPIESYEQVFSIVVWIIGILSVFVAITDIPFIKFLTTLGAASAVIIFIFKDTILGFIASIQVSINDMVRIGDWITFDKYGADGDVEEINLVSVKVRNFDNTITTIPTYALISDSFKNWRGMKESDGRRIKRSIHIKQNSVKYITDEDIEKLKKIQLITSYLEDRKKDIDDYNMKNNVSKEIPLNGRNMTNIGVFRKWVDEYLNQHSAVKKEMTLMVRQLQPTTQGIPIEIYCFSADKRWENYEYIMADIFDHVLPAVKYFDLELFELPSNTNLTKPLWTENS